MAKIAEGVVFRVTKKNYQGTDLYSFKIDGGDWFRINEERHAGVIEEGYTVKVQYEEDKRGNKQVKKAKLVAKGDPVQTKPSGGGRSGGGGFRGGKSAATETSIQYQSARKDALVYVQLLIEQKGVKLPPATKPAERLAAINGLLDEYTALFFADIYTQEAVARSAAERDAPTEREDDDVDTDDDFDNDDDETDNDDEDW